MNMNVITNEAIFHPFNINGLCHHLKLDESIIEERGHDIHVFTTIYQK